MIRSTFAASLVFGTMLLTAPTPILAAEDDAFVEFKVLKPEVALAMASAALENCREQGYQVGVMVVDRFGIPQVFLRDRFAGLHVFETARRKAWTAVSFRTDTSEMDEAVRQDNLSPGLRHLSQAMLVGGGVSVREGEGSLVAGIGVSGAPSPDLDDVCATAGIDAIADDIAF